MTLKLRGWREGYVILPKVIRELVRLRRATKS